MTRPLTVCLLLAVACLGGCSQIAGLTYLFGAQDQTKTVEADYGDMAHSTVAVVVYADERIQYEYPDATLNLSAVVSSELRNKVDQVSIVDPVRVRAYQHEHLGWNAVDKATIGDELGADYVLFIALREYATREPGSLNIFRGHINAQASVFDVHEPVGTMPTWKEEYLETSFPPEATTGVVGDVEDQIRYQTDKAFASLLVKNFYEHEVPRYE